MRNEDTLNFLKRLFELSLGSEGTAENVNGVVVEAGMVGVTGVYCVLHTLGTACSCFSIQLYCQKKGTLLKCG